MFKIFKESSVRAAEKIIAYEMCRRGKRGSRWWTDQVEEAIEEKRKTQGNATEKCARRGQRNGRKSTEKAEY